MNIEELLRTRPELLAPPQPAVSLLHATNWNAFDPAAALEILKSFPSACETLERRLRREHTAEPPLPLAELLHVVPYPIIYQNVWRISIAELYGDALPVYGMAFGQYWRHAAVASLAAEELWNVTSVIEEDITTTLMAAWFHDVGKFVINHALTVRPDFLAKYALAERLTLQDAERSVVQTDHAEVGAQLLQHWRFADNVVKAVRFHHSPNLWEGTALSFLVFLSDICAHSLEQAFGWTAMSPASINEVLDSRGVEWDQIEQVLNAVRMRL